MQGRLLPLRSTLSTRMFSWAPSEYADRIVLVGVGLSLQNEFLRRIVDRPALEPLEEALAEKRRGIGR
ncbi:MAG: hypothetical protein QOD95_3519 [Gammaproteobacteria bacterium]|jgi:hypothetical protein|nr:hypothetical protein [Gammaproteobacteria bacterium]